MNCFVVLVLAFGVGPPAPNNGAVNPIPFIELPPGGVDSTLPVSEHDMARFPPKEVVDHRILFVWEHHQWLEKMWVELSRERSACFVGRGGVVNGFSCNAVLVDEHRWHELGGIMDAVVADQMAVKEVLGSYVALRACQGGVACPMWYRQEMRRRLLVRLGPDDYYAGRLPNVVAPRLMWHGPRSAYEGKE